MITVVVYNLKILLILSYYIKIIIIIQQKHHQDFNTFVLESFKENEIVEIGGSSGTLAKNIIQSKPDISYILIDLCDLNIDIPGVKFIQANCEDYVYNSNSSVVMSHIFEHLHLILLIGSIYLMEKVYKT